MTQRKKTLFTAFCLCIDATTNSYKKERLRSEISSESIRWPLLTDRFRWKLTHLNIPIFFGDLKIFSIF